MLVRLLGCVLCSRTRLIQEIAHSPLICALGSENRQQKLKEHHIWIKSSASQVNHDEGEKICKDG